MMELVSFICSGCGTEHKVFGNVKLNLCMVCDDKNPNEDEICKETCGPCQNGDHKRCQLIECDCD